MAQLWAKRKRLCIKRNEWTVGVHYLKASRYSRVPSFILVTSDILVAIVINTGYVRYFGIHNPSRIIVDAQKIGGLHDLCRFICCERGQSRFFKALDFTLCIDLHTFKKTVTFSFTMDCYNRVRYKPFPSWLKDTFHPSVLVERTIQAQTACQSHWPQGQKHHMGRGARPMQNSMWYRSGL